MRFRSLGQFFSLAVFALAGFVICLSPPALWAQSRQEKVIFSIPSRSIAAIDLYVAKERGFFRDEGLDVDIVQIRGNVAVAAALSGQVQATNGVGTVIRALERSEIPLKVLTVSLKRNLFWLVSRKKSPRSRSSKARSLGRRRSAAPNTPPQPG
jgi:NitT/TauT family transport system substrate-binding protein